MEDSHPHAPQVRETDWPVWHLRAPKEPRCDDAILSAPVREIPEDWGRVLLDWNNYEKDYKDPYDINFNRLHDLYLRAHPEEMKKETAKFADLEKLKEETTKLIEKDAEAKKKAEATMKKMMEEAIDVEKMVRKE